MSKIEWTEQTWNPTTGCDKVSQGCKNCYAEQMHHRLNSMGTAGYELPFTTVVEQPSRLEIPLKRKKPTTYFVNSMSDLFHKSVSDEFIQQVFEVIAATPQHRYQILTKRAERMLAFTLRHNPPPNAWLGVSVENIKQGVARIPFLRQVPANVCFLSIEPLLEDLGALDLRGIHWVIVGGESGSKARRMRSEWVENIQRQCSDQGVSFFFKQWGTWGADGTKGNKKINGRLLNGRQYDGMPAHF